MGYREKGTEKNMMPKDFVKISHALELLPGLLSFVAVSVRTRWPTASCLLTSDVVWRLPGLRPERICAFSVNEIN